MSEVAYVFDESSGLARFVIDTAGPVNTIGQHFITALEKAIESAGRDHPRGVMIVSRKKGSFLDGANLKELVADASSEAIRSTVARYQSALAALATSPYPVVALLDRQSALGGGFELLLWSCDHVFASAGCRLGLPEVTVGLFPAGGGTHTLPRLVGLKTAVDHIMTGRVLPAEDYAGTGLVTICASGDLESSAARWLLENHGITNRNYDPGFRETTAQSGEEKKKIIAGARARFGISPFRPYLLAALDSLAAEIELSFEDATARDVELFVPLCHHPNSRNKIDFFFLATSVGHKLVKVDSSAARKVDKMAVIGAGLMGSGIAQVAADRGIKTTLIDVDVQAAQRSLEKIGKMLEDLVAKGRWSQGRKDRVMSNLSCTADYAGLSDFPLVIESVFEDLSLKRKILARVQDVNPDLIFASNTSTLPMAEIASGAARPEQVVGMHFFSPVPLMQLLEVVQGPGSSVEAVATAVTTGRVMGKTVILVGDGPGFYTSRTFSSYVLSGFKLVELGMSPWDVDLVALRTGFPQGPLHIYGTTGGNVIFHATSFMASRFPDRIKLPESLANMHKAGYVGAGRPCFYKDSRKMIPDDSALDYIVQTKGLPSPTAEEVSDILLLSMVNEAFWCMNDGVLKDYGSMDLGSVLGIGFPDCWHGPARYVSLKGARAIAQRMSELGQKFELPGLTPSPYFDRLVAGGTDAKLI